MAEGIPSRESLMVTDFATIFAHMWYRDFPVQPQFRMNAQRADWTTHIGIAVRSAADLMGLFTHFESVGRTDAVLRNNKHDPVAALEWEWHALHRGDEIVTEFKKLKDLCATPKCKSLSFACLIGYARGGMGMVDYTKRSAKVLTAWTEGWEAVPPLLLVVVHFEWKSQGKRARRLGKGGRQFTNITFDLIKRGSRTPLRDQYALPWNVKGSRWELEANTASPLPPPEKQ